MKISLGRRHALMVGDGAFRQKIDYIAFFSEILNFEGHQNCITGSRVTAILLNGWILPVGGASAVEGLRSTGLPRLVYIESGGVVGANSYFISLINLVEFFIRIYRTLKFLAFNLENFWEKLKCSKT